MAGSYERSTSDGPCAENRCAKRLPAGDIVGLRSRLLSCKQESRFHTR